MFLFVLIDAKHDKQTIRFLIFRLDSRSVFMLDTGSCILLLVGTNVSPQILQNVFGKFDNNLSTLLHLIIVYNRCFCN